MCRSCWRLAPAAGPQGSPSDIWERPQAPEKVVEAAAKVAMRVEGWGLGTEEMYVSEIIIMEDALYCMFCNRFDAGL